MARGMYAPGIAVDPRPWNNFSSSHVKYIHPRYILENDNVTLQGITSLHAYFCVTNPAVNIYDTKERGSDVI
jgi:hypothetical protein